MTLRRSPVVFNDVGPEAALTAGFRASGQSGKELDLDPVAEADTAREAGLEPGGLNVDREGPASSRESRKGPSPLSIRHQGN